jgi:putative spermidine/putrescine transport system ATP-binding protein
MAAILNKTLCNVLAGARLTLERVGHRYGDNLVVDDVSLDIHPGEFVTLLGPSGCGKSTLLRILSGLMAQSEGTLKIDGEDVAGISPAARGVGIVFQNYALFPHMTVASNIAYGLQARRLGDKKTIAQTVERMLDTVRLSGMAKRYPRELSGGQQQRVALARTLAVSPRILLLDEPLGALDKNLRLDMQIEIRRLQRELNITTIMVTHDQEEALSMSDRVAVLNAGRLEQFDSPSVIYDRPKTPFVATFVGTANLIDARLTKSAEGYRASHAMGGDWVIRDPAPCSVTGPVIIAIRPEQWELDFSESTSNEMKAVVQLVMPLGPTLVLDLLLTDGKSIKLSMPRNSAFALTHGDWVRLRLRSDANPAVFLSAS